MAGTGGMDSPPAAAAATVTAFSSKYVSDIYLGRREEMRRVEKERTRRDRQEKSSNKRERSGVRAGGSGLKLAQNKISAGHSRNMREAKDLTKKSVAR